MLLKDRSKKLFFGLTYEEVSRIVLAYEPVWAIGTGKVASPEQAQEVHEFIRTLLKDLFDESLAESMTILYGGSIKANNFLGLFLKSDIDGGLVGGASLSEEFIELTRVMEQIIE